MNAFASTFAAKHRSLRHLLVLGLLLVGSAFYALAQTATIVGTVTDPSGSVVPKVAITITNTDTGIIMNTMSNDAGQYVAPDIKIGHYSVKAEATGFKVSEKTGLTLQVGDRTRLDFSLTVGATKEVVTVEADAIRVQSDSGEISDVITGTQVTQLSTNGRSLYELAVLTPGASSAEADFQVPTPMGGDQTVSFNGQRVSHNLYVVDGAETADRGGSGSIVMPSLDAVAEFRELTSNYDAQYGLSSAATVTTVLKSGTKSFHGGGWWFGRNEGWNARNYFNPAPNHINLLRLNVEGFNIGGPVEFKHSDNPKTFFFYNMEWRKEVATGGVTNRVVPIPSTFGGNLNAAITQGGLLSNGATQIIVPNGASAALNAQFAADGLTPGSPFPNNTIPTNLLNANAQALLTAGIYPAPTLGDTFTGGPNAPTTVREELARVDHTFNDKFSIFGHWISEQISQTDIPTRWSGDNLPTVGDTFGNPSYSATIHTTYAINATLLNEASFNYDGNRIAMLPTLLHTLPSGFAQNKLFGTVNHNIPTIGLGGKTGATYDVNWNPWVNSADDYQVRDDVSWTKGTHQIKMGGSWANFRKLQPLQTSTQGNFNFNGTFTNYDFADFLLGMANTYSEASLEDSRQWNSVSWAAYVQDNWRATHRLTLNLGLRWDGIPHTAEINGQMSNFLPSAYNQANKPIFASSSFNQICSGVGVPNVSCTAASPGLATGPNPALNGLLQYANGLVVPGRNPGTPNQLVNNHWANFGPRIGIAYDLAGNGKTIARAGFGLMFERVQGNDMYQAGGNNLFGGTPTINHVSLSNPHTAVDTGSNISAATLPVTVNSLTELNPSVYKNPASYQYSAGVQQQLGASSVLSMSYVGNEDRYQSEATNINAIPLALTSTATNGNINNFRQYLPYLGYGQIMADQNDANGYYNSFQAELHTHLKRGLQLQVAYTLARGYDSTTNNQDGGDLDTTTNPYLGWKYDLGPSVYDRQQVGFANFVYDLPILRNSSNRFAKSVVGGWQLSGVITMQTGLPVNPGISAPGSQTITNVLQAASLRPNQNGPVSYPKTATTLTSNGQRTLQWFDPSSFSVATTPGSAVVGGVLTPVTMATFGNAIHNSLRGPGRDNWNLSMFKSFAFTEQAHLELRFESFNTFNHTQFNGYSSTIGGGPDVGKITSAFDARVFQFGAKFLF